jgi:microcystin degradation protein MlrC
MMTFSVLTAEFAHESNTFSIRPTDLAAFRARLFLHGSAAVVEREGANTDIAGFMDMARAQGWQTRHAISVSASPAGPVTRAAFDEIAGCILAAAKAGPLDGILLGLHGAMVVEDHPDGEGLLLERLRAVVGPDLPIAVTLDPHANVTARMCDLAQVVMSYSTYPHVDMRDTARRAASLLHRMMTGEIAPRTLRVTRPMLEEANSGRTDKGPMIARHALARTHEGTPGALAVSINAGFGNADIPELGPTVLVTHTGDAGPHLAFAEGLADDIWARRHEVLNRYLTPAEAALEALDHSQPGPLVIADYADNPGAGSYGDAPGLLSALLEAGVADACFGPMVDPEAAAHLHSLDSRSRSHPAYRRQDGSQLRRRADNGDRESGAPVGRAVHRRWPDDRRPARGLGANCGSASGRRCRAGGDEPRPDARPATVPRLRHRSRPLQGRRAEITAALPRRLRTNRCASDRMRQRRSLLARSDTLAVSPRAATGLSAGLTLT